jgi:hypothetical protein
LNSREDSERLRAIGHSLLIWVAWLETSVMLEHGSTKISRWGGEVMTGLSR